MAITDSDIIGKAETDRAETKLQFAGRDSKDFVFQRFTENISVKQGPTILQSRALGGSIFVLGHNVYGILGTSRLGDLGMGAWTWQRVVNPNDTWTEMIRDDTFEGAATAGSWDIVSHNWIMSPATGGTIETKSLCLGQGTITNATPIFHADSIDYGAALNFDGAVGGSEYISVLDAADLSFGDGANDSAFSVSAWINADVVTNFPIISKYGINAATREWFFHLRGGADAGKLSFLVFDSNIGSYLGRQYDTPLNAGEWYHVLSTYNGVGGASAEDGIKLYLNGIRVDNADYPPNGVYVAMHNTAQNVWFGRMINTYCDGRIDEGAIWSRELTKAEVKDIYNQGMGLYLDKDNEFLSTGTSVGGSLVALWHCDEATGGTIYDSSDNSYNGILNNMEDADWVPGKIRIGTGGTFNIFLSANAGGSWDTATNNTLTQFTVPGSDLRLKLTKTTGVAQIHVEDLTGLSHAIQVSYND